MNRRRRSRACALGFGLAALALTGCDGDLTGTAFTTVALDGRAFDASGLPRVGWTATGSVRPRGVNCLDDPQVIGRDSTKVGDDGHYLLRIQIPSTEPTCVRVDVSDWTERADTTFNPDGTFSVLVGGGTTYLDVLWHCDPPAACVRASGPPVIIVIPRPE